MPLLLKFTMKFSALIPIAIVVSAFAYNANAQVADTIQPIELEEVVVKAFEQNRKLKDIPASVQYISKGVLERFSPTSVVHAMNTLPGVRMEERSPGSYRFNIRGSTLRSPFGVRNVKIYYNDLPFTDPGGFTFLNQLGFYNFNAVEVIKGPGSSLYGAGTGGVLLIDGLSEVEKKGWMAEYTTGSYQLHNLYGAVTTGNESVTSKIGFHHQQNNGYRNHSSLRRDGLTWNGRFLINEKNTLKTTFLYSDLFYETPGALTRQEFEINPRSARPGNPAFPGAEAAQASVNEKTFFAGASYNHHFNSSFQNKTSLYGSFTQLRNPTIQNFGRTSEPHAGGRTSFNYTIPINASVLNLNTGLEWQQGFNTIYIHRNAGGAVDTLRTLDEINTRQSFVFTQAIS
jgi:iron complex outermembrane recepter protein